MAFFDVTGVINHFGLVDSIVLHDVTASDYDDRGNPVQTRVDRVVVCNVQVINREDLKDMEGNVSIGDIEIYVSEDEPYVTNFSTDDTLTWRGTTYRVNNVIPLPGHYEIEAKKV